MNFMAIRILYFIQKHRDTEKAEGMFGTLVIQLPSNYSGGKLIVYHQRKKSEFDYSGPSCRSNCYFTSFYADCQHEVKKVTKGYRLCLIYNLMYQGLDECPTPADAKKQVSAIVSAMNQWEEDIESDECPDMMTYLLEHKYCEASLSFRLLKNGDRAVADILTQAKAKVDFDIYVGHINLTEHWAAEHDGYGDYEDVECCDEFVHAEHLDSCDGKHTLSQVEIYKDSFVPEDFFDEIDPDEEEFEEATGNEGATVDKQYNWTALLLWPTMKRTTVIGMNNTVQLFKQDIDAGKKGLDNVARDIMREMCNGSPSIQSCLSFLHALQGIDDTKLIAEMLDVMAGIEESCGFGSFIEDDTFYSSVMAIGHKHGWDILKSPIQTMFTVCSSSNVEKYCVFLNKIIVSGKLVHEKDLCTNLLTIIVKVLADEPDATPNSSSSSSWLYRSYQPPKVYRSKEFVTQLFSLLTAVGSKDLFASIVSTLRTKPVRYPILETLGPAIVDFFKSTKVEKDSPLEMILMYCISQLKFSMRKVLVAPTSNIKSIRLACSCDDCMELMSFMKHSIAVQHRFKMGIKRRQHLQQQLDSSGADVTHTTEHIGSPHTLVVTKSNASYEIEIKRHQQEQVLLASLCPLLSATNVPSENEPPAKKQKATSKVVAGSSSHNDLT